jgi:hypothetical protein
VGACGRYVLSRAKASTDALSVVMVVVSAIKP